MESKRAEIKLSNSETKISSMNAKEDTLSRGVLCDKFEKELGNCCQHIYNIEHQYKAIRPLKYKMTTQDVLLHMTLTFRKTLCVSISLKHSQYIFGAS